MTKPTLIICKHCRKRFPSPGRGNHVYCSLRCCVFSRVIVAGPDDCWEWTATTGHEGYGVLTFRGKIQRAHRSVYEMTNGPIETSSLYVCHTCDNRRCCNPAHLWLGTIQANLADMRQKGRQYDPSKDVMGKGFGNAKLTYEDVLSIRNDRRMTGVIASQYGVSKSTIRSVRARQSWKLIP